jgi:hypothetical protein
MQTLRHGDDNRDVGTLQKLLNSKGANLVVDEDWGPSVDKAVAWFQSAHSSDDEFVAYDLKAGVVGPATWAILKADPQQEEISKDEPKRTQKISELRAAIQKHTPVSSSGVQAALAAANFLGIKEEPDGSNGGPQLKPVQDGYANYWQIPDGSDNRAWCAMLASTAIRLASGGKEYKDCADRNEWYRVWAQIPIEKFQGSTSYLEKWGKKKGLIRQAETAKDVECGEIFTMGRSSSGSDLSSSVTAGHVGMVLWDNGNGSVTTIEGNVSNSVMVKQRKLKDLRGLIKWWR